MIASSKLPILPHSWIVELQNICGMVVVFLLIISLGYQCEWSKANQSVRRRPYKRYEEPLGCGWASIPVEYFPMWTSSGSRRSTRNMSSLRSRHFQPSEVFRWVFLSAQPLWRFRAGWTTLKSPTSTTNPYQDKWIYNPKVHKPTPAQAIKSSRDPRVTTMIPNILTRRVFHQAKVDTDQDTINLKLKAAQRRVETTIDVPI